MCTRAVFLVASCSFALSTATAAAADTSNVPYSLPVTLSPPDKSSPPTAADAPYTPTVTSLINQLLPDSPPTLAEIQNAAQLLRPGSNSSCHNTGTVTAPSGTTPLIAPLCWSDAQGINESGPQANHTSAPQEILGLASSFDTHYANLWGQVEGTEGRELMVTGLFGPQVDLGSDPELGALASVDRRGPVPRRRDVRGPDQRRPRRGADVADEAPGGLQRPVPHRADRRPGPGTARDAPDLVRGRDQAGRRRLDHVLVSAVQDRQRLAAVQRERARRAHVTVRDGQPDVAAERVPLVLRAARAVELHPARPDRRPVADRRHRLRRLAQRQRAPAGPRPGAGRLERTSTTTIPRRRTARPTHSRAPAPTPPAPRSIARHRAPSRSPGSPGRAVPPPAARSPTRWPTARSRCPCSSRRSRACSTRKSASACSAATSPTPTCANPGGVGRDRTGTAAIPDGATSGDPQIGTKNGDAAIIEKGAEEGAVLLKNDANTLPIKSSDLSGGVSVSGGGGEYLVADPSGEAAQGFLDRNHINPLQQLQALSGNDARVHLHARQRARPAKSSHARCSAARPRRPVAPADDVRRDSGLQRSSGATAGAVAPDQVDRSINYTTLTNGQLPGNRAYSWTGSIYVPASDTYTFRLQYSATVPDANVTFTLDGQQKTLASAISFYAGPVLPRPRRQHATSFPCRRPTRGYIESGLTNVQCAVPTSNNPNPVDRAADRGAVPKRPGHAAVGRLAHRHDHARQHRHRRQPRRRACASRTRGPMATSPTPPKRRGGQEDGDRVRQRFTASATAARNAGFREPSRNYCPNGGIIDMDAPTPPTRACQHCPTTRSS